jgi:hypothetical protein
LLIKDAVSNLYLISYITEFLAILAHGVTELQSMLRKLNEWNMEVKGKILVHLSNLDVKFSKVSFSSALLMLFSPVLKNWELNLSLQTQRTACNQIPL